MSVIDTPTIRTTFIILMITGSLALIAVAVSIFSNLNTAPNINTIPTIVVSGQGHATVIPNVAQFSFTVNKTAPTVSVAQTAASTLTNKAIAALTAGGVVQKDISTTGYAINPHYTYSSGSVLCALNGCPPAKQVLDGYDVSQTIEVKVENISSTGSLLQTIGNMGISSVSGITFIESDKNAGQNEARANAIAAAESKAKTMASELGIHLGHIVSFQESSNNPQPIMYAAVANVSQSTAVAPEIPTGQNTVTDNVTITYQIN